MSRAPFAGARPRPLWASLRENPVESWAGAIKVGPLGTPDLGPNHHVSPKVSRSDTSLPGATVLEDIGAPSGFSFRFGCSRRFLLLS